MSLKGLAEGIILQSMEDLWSEPHRAECIAFFAGSEFNICAEIAGMNLSEQVKVLNLVKTVVDDTVKITTGSTKSCSGGGKKPARTARKAYRHLQAVH